RVRYSEAARHLGHRRLERMVAPPRDQSPVHVAHVTGDAATAVRVEGVARMRRVDFMALRAQPIALTSERTAFGFHRELQRMIVRRSVHPVTAGARRLALLKTSSERQRLRTIEAARTPVRPEVTLRIVVGNRLADENRQREI